MESKLPSDHGHHHHYEEDPHHVIEGEGEQGEHHQHKSVLKKVKDKAKKIKDTITKHGHGHSHEHEHGHRRKDNIYQEGYEEEDDDDEEDEVVNDPEVHGAPMYDSAVIRSVNLPKDTNIKVENPSVMRDDKHKQQDLANEGIPRPVAPAPMARTFGRLPNMATGNKNAPNIMEPKFKCRPRVGLVEDPHCPYNSPTEIPHSNYQSKVVDPTGDGGKEANVAPLVSQFGNLDVHNLFDKKPEPEQSANTGSQDQISPQRTPELEKPDLSPKDQDSTTQNTFAGKLSSAATAAAGTAISAKNAVASKLGYGGGGPQAGQGYSPGAGGDTPVAAGGATMKDYLAEKLRPGDEDKALSEVITDALTKKKETTGEGVGGGGGPFGPVTETKREGEDALAAGAESSGQGVVDRLRDAVSAWLEMGDGIQTAQDSVAGSYVSDATTAGGAKRENQ
ncbi:hypothetical protein PHJA_000623700 [Phtheirospermum japonicum]|uniref:Uncharacterized protein n=1 Tax=Phtheirospermum japonicum TaxID=374723 RepID=A0A830BHD4_9LAMI|nr:hypothetical protein PHJA_000623700 [Phtheirospermum japonicum]